MMKITKTEHYNRIQYTNELGQLNREDGPAVEYANGTKVWHINGKQHRLDGPAFEHPDGYKSWYYHGESINCKTQKEFERIIKLAILF